MSKRLFSPEQITDLLRNPNVAKCSERYVSYSEEFKIQALKLYREQGFSPMQIFIDAGFNPDLIGYDIPKDRLKAWNKLWKRGKFSKKTNMSSSSDKIAQKGRPKNKWSSEADQIEYLKAKVAYLQAENDFLARLRSGKTE